MQINYMITIPVSVYTGTMPQADAIFTPFYEKVENVVLAEAKLAGVTVSPIRYSRKIGEHYSPAPVDPALDMAELQTKEEADAAGNAPHN